MAKTMLVNVTHVEESRVAILEDGVLEQYEIETLSRTSIKGNIHNAVVENVHPALEAAFLRISPDLKGFLPLDEVNFKLLPQRSESRKGGKIGQHLHPGQKLMVQVVREPYAGKPPTVTTYFSLPGRYLVLMPGVDSAGISRKIEDAAQREKLKKTIEELAPPEGFGVIVRTAGVGQSKVELQRDLRYLLRLWDSIGRASRQTEFPGAVYRERDLVIRTMRDYFTPDIDEVWVDNPDTYERALEFVKDVMPTKAKVLKLYTGDRPLFAKFNLEEQIESIYKRRVPLKSGGEIVIDGTEALTAIDVNSKGSPRQGGSEENAVGTNLEAAAEIGRQLRLRDLGGLVVIDFIDMEAARNQKKVEQAMRAAMKNDRAKYDVTRISKLGLMEIARQRLRGEKIGASYTTCPVCEGFGLVKNVEPAGLAALRKLQMRATKPDLGKIRMGLPPDVAHWVLNHKRDELVSLERRAGIKILVEPKGSLLRHESEFEFFPREKVEPPPALVLPDRAAPPPPPDLKELEAAEEAEADPSAVGPDDSPAARVPKAARDAAEPGVPGQPAETDGGRKRRRRRRRRGKGGGGEVGAQDTAPGLPPSEPMPAPFEIAPPTASPVEDDIDDEDDDEAGTDGPSGEPQPLQANGQPAPGEGGGRRRRRRRRRRGRGGGQGPLPGEPRPEGAAPQPQPSAPPQPAPPPDEVYVPRHVRVNELMPAAVGRRQRPDAEPMKPRPPRRRRGALRRPADGTEAPPEGSPPPAEGGDGGGEE
jgi:ribonuclease E